MEIVRKADPSLWVPQWLAESQFRESSRQTYAAMIQPFFGWVQEAGRPLDRAGLIAFRDHLRARVAKGEIKGRTANTILAATRQFFRWATESGRLAANPANLLRNLDVDHRTHAKSALTPEQLDAVLATCKLRTSKGCRDHAMISLACLAALRPVEIVRANVGDIQEREGRVVIYVAGKGRDDRGEWVALVQAVQRSIGRYLSKRGRQDASEPLFLNSRGGRLTVRGARGVIVERFRKVGIWRAHRVTAHSLRKTGITWARLAGADLLELQIFARHRNPATTQIYIDEVARAEGGAETKLERYLGDAKAKKESEKERESSTTTLCGRR